MALLSIIVPCYNEEAGVEAFYARTSAVCAALRGVETELLFVDDGSSDGTLSRLKALGERERGVRWLSLSRNFGKEAAMYAGLEHANGEYVAVMDADLQDPPELLPQLLELVRGGGYDCAAVRRVDRKGEPPIRSWFARRFYKLINKMSRTEIVDGARDYRLMTRQMADAILRVGEYNRFSKGIFGWIGFRTYWLSYENVERVAGETKWNFWKLFKYAVDGIINFSQAPLSIASWFGIFMTFISFLMLIFIVVRKVAFGDPVDGWASTICVMIFIGGVQLFCLGIMGQYIAKTYMESKHRPHYIISETNQEDIIKVK